MFVLSNWGGGGHEKTSVSRVGVKWKGKWILVFC